MRGASVKINRHNKITDITSLNVVIIMIGTDITMGGIIHMRPNTWGVSRLHGGRIEPNRCDEKTGGRAIECRWRKKCFCRAVTEYSPSHRINNRTEQNLSALGRNRREK